MISRASAVLAVSLLLVPAAHANWFSKKVGGNIDLHKQIGDGISAIAQPTISSAETASRNILEDADRRAGVRIDQVEGIADRQVKNVDVLLEHRIGQVDAIAATRLAQVEHIADKEVKRIDAIATKSINDIDGRLQA